MALTGEVGERGKSLVCEEASLEKRQRKESYSAIFERSKIVPGWMGGLKLFSLPIFFCSDVEGRRMHDL